MVGALGDVAAAGVAEHVGDVLFGIDLEQMAHGCVAFGAGWIFNTLDPIWPAEQFVVRGAGADCFGKFAAILVVARNVGQFQAN